METITTALDAEMTVLPGMNFINPLESLSLLVRFVLNLVVVTVIARYFYYPKGRRSDYLFVFEVMSICIFMLVSVMAGDAIQTGAALGLFAIFGIIRYRTEAIPIREMTYLFMLVSVSVINAMGGDKFHPGWEGIGFVTILLIDAMFIVLAWLFERSKLNRTQCTKYIWYDNVDLIAPTRRGELTADLEKRTGLRIERVEVGTVDFLRDCCLVRIFYNEPLDEGSTIENIRKIPKS